MLAALVPLGGGADWRLALTFPVGTSLQNNRFS